MRILLIVALFVVAIAAGKAQTYGNNFTIDLGPTGKTLLTPMPVVPSTTLPPPTCTHSFVYLTGSCYKGIKVSATWPEALAYCEVFGAELAIIGSQEEQTAVEGYLASLHDPEYGSRKHHEYWFGANDIVTEGDWKWAVTMVTINYTNWYNNNPDNGGDDSNYYEEHCAEMSEKRNWQWNDDGCEEEKHFLCEMITED